jgi:hypothetical protein
MKVNVMLKRNFPIKKAMALSLALTGMACAMDELPLSKAQEIAKPQSFTLYGPSAEELTEASNSEKNKELYEFVLKDKETTLNFHVWRNVSGPYRFDHVDVGHTAPCIDWRYTNLAGEGLVMVRLYSADFAPKNVVELDVNSSYPVKRGRYYDYANTTTYKALTGNAKDIAITCKTKNSYPGMVYATVELPLSKTKEIANPQSFPLYLPSAEEITTIIAEKFDRNGYREFDLKDEGTSLTFQVIATIGNSRTYKFDHVDVAHTSPCLEGIFKPLEGEGKISVRLYPKDFAAKNVVELDVGLSYPVKKGLHFDYANMTQYTASTGNAEDIAITCNTK